MNSNKVVKVRGVGNVGYISCVGWKWGLMLEGA